MHPGLQLELELTHPHPLQSEHIKGQIQSTDFWYMYNLTLLICHQSILLNLIHDASFILNDIVFNIG